jgi:hypothetical protein
MNVTAMVVAGCMLCIDPLICSSLPDEGAAAAANGASQEVPFGRDDQRCDRGPTGAVRITGEKFRDWKNVYGDSVQGRFLGLAGAAILLEVEDGVLSCALALFGLEDREYVRNVLRSCGQADLFPGVSDPEDAAAKLTLTKSQWQTQLGKWGKAVARAQQAPREAEAAWKHLRNVRDPAALQPLLNVISRPTADAVRSACVEAIAGIGSPEAVRALVELAATQTDVPVRAQAVWALCYLKDPLPALDEFSKYLRVDRFRDPSLVCLRAAALVRPLGYRDSPPEIVETLIDILWIQEVFRTPGTSIHGGGFTGWANGSGASGGISRSEHLVIPPRTFRVPRPCEMARKILVEESGQDYGYDRRAWRRWYDERRAAADTRGPDDPRSVDPKSR